MSLSLPPALPGLPLLGNAWDYYRDPVALLQQGYERHGLVFSIRLGPKGAAVLIGPDHARTFFLETDRRLSISDTFQWLVPLFGEHFPLVAQPDDHRRHRPLLLQPLRGAHLARYVEALATEAEVWLEPLGDEGELELTELFGHAVFFGLARALLGEDARAYFGLSLWDLIADLTNVHADHAARRLRVRVPRLARLRAKRELHRGLREIVAARRRDDGKGRDYLQALLDTRPGGGRALPDALVFDLVLGMVWGGHATTWGHSCWALIQLLQNPGYLASVVEELPDPREAPTLEALDRQVRLEWALKETERMRPPVLVIGRRAREDVEIGGHRIPRGWQVLLCPPVSHRLPEVFSDPDRYDPERFSPERAEDRRHPFGLIGFGGGSHRCLGKDFAMVEMKLLLGALLQRHTLELVDRDPVRKPGPDPNRPRAPVRVRYRRRQPAAPTGGGR